MRKKVILFLISLLIPILSFSQDICYPKTIGDSLIVITPLQLKKTNLIFLEHRKFKLENNELKLQTDKYKQLYSNYLVIDSVNASINSQLRTELLVRDEELQKQLKIVSSQKKQIKAITIGGITVSVALLVFILCR